MIPHWVDAPKWANWLAQDEDGEWHWFEDEPEALGWCREWISLTGGNYEWARTTPCHDRWYKTLRKRT